MVRVLDWIRQRMTNNKDSSETRPLEVIETDVTNKEYKLRFYENRNGRHTVHYDGTHLCTCGTGEFNDVREYFNTHYDGNNLEQVSSELKGIFNKKIYNNRVYTKSRKRGKTGTKKRGRRRKSFRENRLQFEDKGTGRIQVKVSDNGKTQTVCQCYKEQIDEVQRKFDSLKYNHGLDEIKVIMKGEYNLHKNGRNQNKHEIIINSNGLCYKDGRLQKLDPSVYDKANKLF